MSGTLRHSSGREAILYKMPRLDPEKTYVRGGRYVGPSRGRVHDLSDVVVWNEERQTRYVLRRQERATRARPRRYYGSCWGCRMKVRYESLDRLDPAEIICSDVCAQSGPGEMLLRALGTVA